MLQTSNQEMLMKREVELRGRLAGLRGLDFQLNMARGLPSPEQLDLANSLLTLPGVNQYQNTNGVDCRNYGAIDGLLEMKKLFAGILDCSAEISASA